MKFVFALFDSRRYGVLPCRLGKSLFLVFSFAENHESDFLLQNLSYIERAYKEKSDNRCGLNPNWSLDHICLDLLLPSCFLPALVRLPTSALPSHLDVARYAFDETSAHLLNNRTKSVKDSNDRFGLKILYVDNAKSYDQYVLKTQNYGMRKQNTLYWSYNTGCFGVAI